MFMGLEVLGLAAVASALASGNANNRERMARDRSASECNSNGGTAAGGCAEGFGVCCIFTVSCGSSSSQNCTYFESSGSNSRSGHCCVVKICPVSNTQVCQLRLDFVSFSIAQPSTSTSVALTTTFGHVSHSGTAVPQTLASQCQTDVFSVTSPGSPSPPVICGLNTGEHMYVDASPSCNALQMELGIPSDTANAITRSWQIKVTQYACDYPNLAPPGCTQYFTGASTGTFQTFNFEGGAHLANQDQKFCFRKERGVCRICYSISSIADFQTSWGAPQNVRTGMNSQCCGYGTNGKFSQGYDCLLVPAVSRSGCVGTCGPFNVNAFCGGGGTGTKAMLTPGGSSTVCSRLLPFELSFLSDAYESQNEVMGTRPNVGFKLNYELQDC